MRKIFLDKNELHFEGNEVKLGDKIELEGALAGAFEQSKFKGDKEYTVVATFPSINTGVCDMQTARLNQIAKEFPNFNYVTFSMDLPSALAGYKCEAQTDKVKMYSDYLNHKVGKQLGLIIKEIKLLGRAMFILDKDNKVIYKQINSQIVDQVDFDKLIAELKKLS